MSAPDTEPRSGALVRFGGWLGRVVPRVASRLWAAVVGLPAFVRGPLRSWLARSVVAPLARANARFGPRVLGRRVAPVLGRTWRHPLVRTSLRLTRRGVRAAVLGGLLAALVVGGFALCTHRVPPGVLAVRHARFFGGGVEQRDYTLGLHFGIRGLHDWHDLPERTCFLVWSENPLDGELPLLKVRTDDADVVRVGVSVPFRIVPGEAHRLVAAGKKDTYVDEVRNTVERVLLRELAKLSTEEFKLTEARLARSQAALEALDRELADLHVRAEGVHVSSVHFRGDYELKLQETQLLAQETIMNRALVEYETAKQDIGIEDARIRSAESELRGEFDLALETDRAEADAEIAAIRREFLEYEGRRKGEALAAFERITAEGEAAVDRANAYRTRRFAEVYEDPGTRRYLASIAAANLAIEEVSLDPTDPGVPSVLDLDGLIELLVGADE